MKSHNYKQVKSRTLIFWTYFIILTFFAFLPVFCFVKSYEIQKEYINFDINNYKELLNKQLVLQQKIDSLYNDMALLNSGKVENNLFLEYYIAENKDKIDKVIDKDSTVEFKHYAFLMDNINNMLKLKDTIRVISNKEQLAYKDLLECINKTRKIKKDISYDPARNFSSKNKPL
jgi:hypothetical protein